MATVSDYIRVADGRLDKAKWNEPEPVSVAAAAARPGVGEGLAELLAVRAGPRRQPIKDVLGGDLQAAAGRLGAQYIELVARLLLVGADSRPHGAAGGHE
jgi:hypothetical protein